MLELLAKTREYLDYVERHYNNVQKAWKELNEKCKGHGFNWLYDDSIWHLINLNIKHHDESKLSRYEFMQYRQFFYPTSYEQKDKVLMDYGWQHHLEQNPHHWQNWTKHHPTSIEYLIENICDWMAMGYEFGDTAQEYYENNKDKIFLPEWAIKEMYKIFEIIYPQKGEEKVVCPKCGNGENLHFNYDYGKKELPVIDVLCNECGEFFKLEKQHNGNNNL